MNKKFKRIRQVVIVSVILTFVFAVSFCYTYWNQYHGSSIYDGFEINIGNFDFSGNAIDRLPPNTPQDVIQKLEELEKNNPPEVMDALIDGIIGIIKEPNYNGNIHIGADINGVFDDSPVIGRDDLIVYTTTLEDGSVEFVLIHINPNSNAGNITTVDRLEYVLSQTWTGVNMASRVWLSGNLYYRDTMPVEYQGRYFLKRDNGSTPVPLNSSGNVDGAWFEYSPTSDYLPNNTAYMSNHIVRFNGQYFRAIGWTTAEPVHSQWGPWQLVNEWQSGSYNANDYVFTIQDNAPRFWRALKSTSAEPSELSAASGDWQEYSNGWVSPQSGNDVFSHYFAHNTYAQNDVIIYGVTPRLRYRYFRAKGAVPADETPLVYDSEGVLQINSAYWEQLPMPTRSS